ncbi:hypothetical protein VNO77_30130 [Canavalia gladiata]|uniref:Uncharacterized protein n=1 Tax=Canavalia gladiata TaxID=3824 RepID=A0AAN9Q452_CANGL
MAKYSSVMLVFGLGMLVVSLWCMKVSEGSDDDFGEPIHAVRREGCESKHEGGVEECTGEDDHLGLYADVDDTFRGIHHAASRLLGGTSPADNDDSPDAEHNNFDVLGH